MTGTRSLAAVTKVLLAERRKTLLLGDGVDVGADDKGNDIEKRDPGLLGKELLGKCQADGRGDPADAHNLPEADLDGSANLMICPSASNERHGNKVDGILDRGNLL